jgi:hypothetical protein
MTRIEETEEGRYQKARASKTFLKIGNVRSAGQERKCSNPLPGQGLLQKKTHEQKPAIELKPYFSLQQKLG